MVMLFFDAFGDEIVLPEQPQIAASGNEIKIVDDCVADPIVTKIIERRFADLFAQIAAETALSSLKLWYIIRLIFNIKEAEFE